jgi:hypothetical protein
LLPPAPAFSLDCCPRLLIGLLLTLLVQLVALPALLRLPLVILVHVNLQMSEI